METEVTEPTTTETTVETPTEAPSINAQAKELPWVKELMSKAKEADELKAAQEQARKEAEIKDLESKGQYEAAIKARDEELERIKSTHQKEILTRDLTNELIKARFDNDFFVKGAISEYNAEQHGNVSEYVASLAAMESNKAFMAGQDSRTVHTPPGAAPKGGGSQDWESVKRDLESPDRQTRINARSLMTSYREKNGKYPF